MLHTMILGILSDIQLPSLQHLCYESSFAWLFDSLEWPTRIPRETPVYATMTIAIIAYLAKIAWADFAVLRLSGLMLAIGLPLSSFIRDLKRWDSNKSKLVSLLWAAWHLYGTARFRWRSLENSKRTMWACYGLAFYVLHFVAETLHCPFDLQMEPRMKEMGKLFVLMHLLLLDWRDKKRSSSGAFRKKNGVLHTRDGSSSDFRRLRHFNVNVNHWSVSSESRRSSAQVG